MNHKPKRWKDMVQEMPHLSAAQAAAVNDIVMYHLEGMVFDFPRIDDAVYMIQQDLKTITDAEPK